MRTVNPGEIYRHFKNKLYQIIAVAYHSETKEKYVVYQALYGDFKTYIRPYDMFLSEVDHVKYPEVRQVYRFEKVNPDTELSESCIPHTQGQGQTAATTPIESEQLEDTAHIEIEQPTAANRTEIEPKTDTAKTTEGSGDGEVNPLLMGFFDQNTSDERMEYLRKIHTQLNDRLINDMAASLDLTVDEGDIDTRYQSLLNCLRTMAQFETNRFR